VTETNLASDQLNIEALNFLLDVKLPLSISFGSAHLPLKDVLKLTIGSSVELNRVTGDPVEVIVNDRVIARGEVVEVNGNYGVRIKQIVGRGEGAQDADTLGLAKFADAVAATGSRQGVGLRD
jgi:flagellar motor switch protein FliN